MSKIKLPHASGNSVSIAAPQSNPAADRTLYLPSNADGTVLTTTYPKVGSVIQVVNSTFTSWDASAIAANAWWDNPGAANFRADITPTSTSSKILVFGHVYMSCSTDGVLPFVKIRRDTTDCAVGDTSGSRRRINGMGWQIADYKFVPLCFSCLDSPSSTSELQYTISIGHWSGSSRTFYVNRSITDSDDYGNPRSVSTITAMEIAQ